MKWEELPQSARADLETQVFRRIETRTGGRLRGLEVQIRVDGLTVLGHAPTYYLLEAAAAAAAREAAAPVPVTVSLQILPATYGRAGVALGAGT